jgi:hypothetical protein
MRAPTPQVRDLRQGDRRSLHHPNTKTWCGRLYCWHQHWQLVGGRTLHVPRQLQVVVGWQIGHGLLHINAHAPSIHLFPRPRHNFLLVIHTHTIAWAKCHFHASMFAITSLMLFFHTRYRGTTLHYAVLVQVIPGYNSRIELFYGIK